MAAATKFGDVPSNPAGGRWFHFPTFRGMNAAVRDCQSFKSINKNRLNYLWISISMICFDLSKSSSSSFGWNISLSFNHHRTQSFFLLIPRWWQGRNGHNGHNGVIFFLIRRTAGPTWHLGPGNGRRYVKKRPEIHIYERLTNGIFTYGMR